MAVHSQATCLRQIPDFQSTLCESAGTTTLMQRPFCLAFEGELGFEEFLDRGGRKTEKAALDAKYFVYLL